MQEPKIPECESVRIKTLQALNILDTEAEERFDRFTRLAANMFAVPIALVSLVDTNRQWFKSKQGLSACETGRDISFCGHTINEDQILLVEDATKDERFFDNPLVTAQPDIRFYAGCPLKHPNGQKLGTLCLIDTQPKHFGEDDLETLCELGALAELELVKGVSETMEESEQLSNRIGFNSLANMSLKICQRHHLPAGLITFKLSNSELSNSEQGSELCSEQCNEFSRSLIRKFRYSDVIGQIEPGYYAVLLTNASEGFAQQMVDQFTAAMKVNHVDISFEAKLHNIADYELPEL